MGKYIRGPLSGCARATSKFSEVLGNKQRSNGGLHASGYVVGQRFVLLLGSNLLDRPSVRCKAGNGAEQAGNGRICLIVPSFRHIHNGVMSFGFNSSPNMPNAIVTVACLNGRGIPCSV